MRIGVITPVGTTEKYGYQYEEYNRLIIKNLASFADYIYIISTSKHNNPDIYKGYDNLEYFSNEDTWFKYEDDEEIFSFAKIDENINFCKQLLIESDYDISLLIHSNQYVPKSSELGLKNVCEKLLKKKKPYGWLYKKYMCGRLLFNADRRVPWMLNLTIENPWNYRVDSIINQNTNKIITIQTGNYKRYNSQAIRDVQWDLTLKDEEQKYAFFIKELRILNGTYDPNDPDNLKFDKEEFISYMQRKINNKKVSKERIDEIGEKLLNLRKNDFCSKMYEENYKYKNKNV